MSNEGVHNGGNAFYKDVTTSGIKVMDKSENPNMIGRTMAVFSNPSDTIIYLILKDSSDGVTCPGEEGEGIALAPNGAGIYEMVQGFNMCTSEIWAIHGGSGAKRLSIQTGR